MKYVYITLFLLHKADKISSVKVRYEREADTGIVFNNDQYVLSRTKYLRYALI